mgnify:FL=1
MLSACRFHCITGVAEGVALNPLEISPQLLFRKELTLRQVRQMFEREEWDELKDTAEILVCAWIQQCVVSDWLASEAGETLVSDTDGLSI